MHLLYPGRFPILPCISITVMATAITATAPAAHY